MKNHSTEETGLLADRRALVPNSHHRKWVLSVVCLVVAGVITTLAWPKSGQTSFSSASLPLVGKSHKRDKKHRHHDHSGDEEQAGDVVASCQDGHYSEHTLKLAYEIPFAALFLDNKGRRKYEASDVIVVNGTQAYAVCDASWAIATFPTPLTPLSGTLVGPVSREPYEDSGYEAILYEKGAFYVVRESIQHEDTKYHAVIEELVNLDAAHEDYDIRSKCSCEFEFEGDSKGFEGAVAVYDLNNTMVILGLCEGNHCSEKFKHEKGNGRLVAMRRQGGASSGLLGCQWETVRTIHVPPMAYFGDYSAITMTDEGRVAITSQEESKVWIGKMTGQNADGLWDIEAMEFVVDDGAVLDFPKNDMCETVYCNIEGIHWLNSETLMAVSDKMKGKGRQDYRCFDKDQSVHVFVLPK